MTIQLTSSAFKEGGNIPRRHTCDGEDLSPSLSWTGIPAGTHSLALIVDDPDAPRGDWVHWVLFDLLPDLDGLPEGVAGTGTAGKNDFGRLGYGGPCPPRGSNHRYYFKLYALDQTLGLKPGATKVDVETAMTGHILAKGQVMGRYER
jgi:Raf kinase inhibitor-like YbhB/YbcL family protein